MDKKITVKEGHLHRRLDRLPYFLKKLLPNKSINFFYFETCSEIIKADVEFNNIHSLHGKFISPYDSKSILYKYHLIAEKILSSPQNQFIKFKGSTKIFSDNEKGRDFAKIKQIHLGIEEFFKDLIKLDNNIFKRRFDINLVENLFAVLFDKEKITTMEDIKSSLSVKDNFSGETVSFFIN